MKKLLPIIFLSLGYAMAQGNQSSTADFLKTNITLGANYGVCEKAIIAGFRVSKYGELMHPIDMQEVEDYSGLLPEFAALRKAYMKQGINVVLLILPLKGMMPAADGVAGFDYRKLRKTYYTITSSFREVGYRVPNMMQGTEKLDLLRRYFIPLDHHLTSYAGQDVSKILAKQIMVLPEYKDIAKNDYTTSNLGLVPRPWKLDSRAVGVNAQCEKPFDFPTFSMPFFETKGSDQDLFADDEIPDIVQVGTSQSLQERNISGFTSEIIRADIISGEYVDGAGAYLGMQRYLVSANYVQHKPKILIWEFSLEEMGVLREGGVSFRDKSIFKQLIPAVYGNCSTVASNSETNKISLPVRDSSRYNYVVLGNSDQTRTQVQINYLNVESKSSSDMITVSNRIPRGQIYFEIPNDVKKGSSIDIIMLGSESPIDARICSQPR